MSRRVSQTACSPAAWPASAWSGAVPAQAQRPAPAGPGPHPGLRRPDNMPSSNDKGEGFENKIAELIATELKAKLTYVWYPTRRGYFRILNGMYCDMAMEAPAGLDMTGVTKPYFRSGYVFVARRAAGSRTSSRWPTRGSRSSRSASTCTPPTPRTRRRPWP